MAEWYVKRGNRQDGPWTTPQLEQAIHNKQVGKSDLVRSGDEDDWIELSSSSAATLLPSETSWRPLLPALTGLAGAIVGGLIVGLVVNTASTTAPGIPLTSSTYDMEDQDHPSAGETNTQTARGPSRGDEALKDIGEKFVGTFLRDPASTSEILSRVDAISAAVVLADGLEGTDGISRDELLTEVEHSLQISGIKINDESLSHYVTIAVDGVWQKEMQFFSFSIRLTLTERVVSMRNGDAIPILAEVYSSGYTGFAGSSVIGDSIADGVAKAARNFSNDWMKAKH